METFGRWRRCAASRPKTRIEDDLVIKYICMGGM